MVWNPVPGGNCCCSNGEAVAGKIALNVLDALIRSRKHDGDELESKATSATPRWMEGEKLARLGTVNSAEDQQSLAQYAASELLRDKP